MSLCADVKSKIINDFGLTKVDTGSPESQIALLTNDINKLTNHFKFHAKDHHSRCGLIRKVNLRRKLLRYLKNKSIERYSNIIKRLGLRG